MTAGSEGSPVFDYTSLDFSSVEQDLIRFAQTAFPEEIWTDLNESNEGRRLIELMAYAVDLLAYTENSHALETVAVSASRERNFRAIAKGFDFQMKSASPSRTTLKFVLDPSYLPLTIPDTFRVADEATGEVVFQPDVSTLALTSEVIVTATQGRGVYDEELGVSNGSANQVMPLANPRLIDDTEVISVSGVSYRKVTNFIEAGPLEEVYTLETDELGVSSISFGDNINGKTPPLGATITASYKVGGGVAGNLPPATVKRLVDSLPGIVSVVNIDKASGGGPRQSLASAKRALPLYIKSNDRCVTAADYAAVVEASVPGVLRAIGISGRFRSGGAPMQLLIVPSDGGDVSPVLVNQVITTLRHGSGPGDYGRAMAGKRITAQTARYVYLQVEAEAFVNKGAGGVVVRDRVKNAFKTRYSLTAGRFAEAVSLQDAYNTVDPHEQSIDGLARVYIRRFRVKEHAARYVNLPTTGNGDVQTLMVNEDTAKRVEWNIAFRLPEVGAVTEYVVTKRLLGSVTTVGADTIEDDGSSFVDGELVGKFLHVREQDQSEVFEIIGNSGSLITVSLPSVSGSTNSLLSLCEPGDSYAVEDEEPIVGVNYFVTTAIAHSIGATVLTVPNTVGVDETTPLVITNPDGEFAVVQPISTTPTTITISEPLPLIADGGSTLAYLWRSEDGTTSFSMSKGSSPWAPGDSLYVDTYPKVGDIRLRPENFPRLRDEDIVVHPVGGAR